MLIPTAVALDPSLAVVGKADNVMEVFSLAHRFAMSELQRACTEVLDECMNCNDVCRVLEAAEYYGQPELASKCWDLIKENTPRCYAMHWSSLVCKVKDKPSL